MKAYQYVVLRLVPRVDRDEFLNVGVVLYCQDADFLEAAWELDEARVGAFAPSCDLDGVRGMLERVRAVCRGETGRGLPTFDKRGQRFGWIIAPRSTVVQPGPVHGGLTDDPAAELERLLARLVRVDRA
ncbi:DUF3037 domain-containing protein [Intrasporangium sp.]|uniref:DUF3037 domain-containing protein n=1 Tax=Intrasporangium sp. TaxID=1925024 RepID=UPI0029399E8B|nr:DUF3037 domain-containing protein [Intrasporangium sp.]MDV3220102.1 DUF3037 domain-containing protein [Intrasporangium sp.]